jgi:ceramide glucosyltransferase
MLFAPGRILEFLLLTLWLVPLVAATLGTAWAFRVRRRKFRGTQPLPGISILKPLKGLDAGIRENLESFFRLRYSAGWELIFSVAEHDDPAVPLVRELIDANPEVRARLLVGDVRAGINPKVNNLVRPFAYAAHDWVLISDSNTRVDSGFLSRMAEGITERTGLRYCVVAGAHARGLGGRLDAVSLNSVYARGTFLADAGGLPCVTGKAMLVKKAIIEELGGIRAFAPEVAEDFVIGQAFLRMGWDVDTCARPVLQHVGSESFGAYWRRSVRWGRIRKIHAPRAIFLSEPLLTSIGSGLAGAAAMHWVFHGNAAAIFFASMLYWALMDQLLVASLGVTFGWRDFGAWLLREALHPLLWVHIALGDTVEWRGSHLKMERSGVLERITWEHGERARALEA